MVPAAISVSAFARLIFDHGPRQQILRISWHQRHAAGRCHQRHGHRHVVHAMIQFDIELTAAQIASVTARSTAAFFEPPMKISPTSSRG
jgi:hypothetical protein